MDEELGGITFRVWSSPNAVKAIAAARDIVAGLAKGDVRPLLFPCCFSLIALHVLTAETGRECCCGREGRTLVLVCREAAKRI